MLDRIVNSMPSYDSFQYWFIPEEEVSNAWAVLAGEGANTSCIGVIDQGFTGTEAKIVKIAEGYEDEVSNILSEFEMFKQRPEYFVAKPVEGINGLDQESLIEAYEVRLLGIAFERLVKIGKNPDENIKAAMNSIEWLRGTDFYSAPGSTQYHDSEPCGLLKHSLRVFNHILRLKYDDAFYSVGVHSAALIALTHDWCKIGLYEMYMRNVKNEDTGKWEQVPAYRHNQTGIPLGHGVTSMFLASKLFKLSVHEALALRWHMGEYNVASNEQNELHLANETTPLVFLIQFADRLAITKYAN